jgi:hypothetical protein
VEGSAPSAAENRGLGIVEWLTPSKTEQKPTSSISIRRARYVGALTTPGVMAHHGKEREKKRKTFG